MTVIGRCPKCGTILESITEDEIEQSIARRMLAAEDMAEARVRQRLEGAVGERDRWRDCARKLYAQWQAGERPPSESALGRVGFQMRESKRGQ